MKHYLFIFFLFTAFHLPVKAQVPALWLPDFTFFSEHGKPYNIKSLEKGKKIFFVFFDAGCEHCQRTVGEINKRRASFSDVSVIFVSQDGWEEIRAFRKRYAPALEKQKNVLFLRDSLNQFIIIFRPRRYPGMFLYGDDKKLIDYEDNDNTLFRIEHALKNNK